MSHEVLEVIGLLAVSALAILVSTWLGQKAWMLLDNVIERYQRGGDRLDRAEANETRLILELQKTRKELQKCQDRQ